MAGKLAIKKEKSKPVLTARACAKCGDRMMSDKVTTVLVLGFEGAKRSSTPGSTRARAARSLGRRFTGPVRGYLTRAEDLRPSVLGLF